MTAPHKWFIYVMIALFELIYIQYSILICIDNPWGYFYYTLIAILIFACLLGFFLETNRVKKVLMNLEQFMVVWKIEREAMTAKNEGNNVEKLKKILKYTPQPFIKFGFTDDII